MGRLQNTQELAYVPTQAEILPLIASQFTATAKVLRRFVDPCCGTGQALADLVKLIQPVGVVQRLGIELSYNRAREAQNLLDTVLPTSFYNPSLRWSERSTSVILNNPPYDFSDQLDDRQRHIRHERLFVVGATVKLVTGGHQVIIVPRHLLLDKALVEHLLGYYTQIIVRQYPPELFELHHQIVIFAIGRRERRVSPKKDAVAALQDQAPVDLPELATGEFQFEIPAAPTRLYFEYRPELPEDLITTAARINPIQSAEFDRARYVEPLGATLRPLVTLDIGHLAGLMSGRRLGVIELPTPGGAILTKGTSRKVVEHHETVQKDKKGKVTHVEVSETERIQSSIALINPDGKRRTLIEVGDVRDFMMGNAHALGEVVMKRNAPLYDYRPTNDEWVSTGQIGLGLPPLPGRKERGLFDLQRHFAIALARGLRTAKHVFFFAKPGFGKTASTVATLTLRNRWPAIVTCPAHMKRKWARDIERAADPTAPIKARIITRPIRAGGMAWHTRIAPLIKANGGDILETSRLQVKPESPADTCVRRRISLCCSPAAVDNLTRVFKRLTFRDRRNHREIPPKIQRTADGLNVVYVDRDAYTLADFHADYARWSEDARRQAESEAQPRVGDVVRVKGIWQPDGSLLGQSARRVKRERVNLPHQSGDVGKVAGQLTVLNGARWIINGVTVDAAQVVVEYDRPKVRAVAIVSFEVSKYGPGISGLGVRPHWVEVEAVHSEDSEDEVVDTTLLLDILPVLRARRTQPMDWVKRLDDLTQQLREIDQTIDAVDLADEGDLFAGSDDLNSDDADEDEAPDAEPANTGTDDSSDLPFYRAVQSELGQTRWRLPGCPVCGSTFEGKVPKTCTHVEFVDVLDDKGKVSGSRSRRCDAPLRQMGRWRRIGLARLLQRYYRGFFKVYVPDEIHNAQNQRSDIGLADQRYLSVIPESVALTGSPFGGAAMSLFGMLYRRDPQVRRLYPYRGGAISWVDHYGRWERLWKQRKPSVIGVGVSGDERWGYRQREMPGVSPGVFQYLLPRAVFADIRDLGYTLPPLRDNIVWLEMTQEMEAQYKVISTKVFDDATALLSKGDPAGLSFWWAAMRYRPASAFRFEKIAYPGMERDLPAVISAAQPYLPKETKLAEIVQQARALGRKTLVYCEQTGKRDIRHRLKQVLEERVPGVRVSLLSANSMDPEEREAWIDAHITEMDVLIVNPILIETGLDLIHFSRLVFYETPEKLKTLLQAKDRVHRLGQARDVEVFFLAYKGTIEEAVLQKMGLKIKASELLFGKEAAGVLIEQDDDDIKRQLIREALEGLSFHTVGERVSSLGLSNGSEQTITISTSPLGSLSAPSVPLALRPIEVGETVLQLGLFGNEAVQLDLFGGRQVAPNRKRK